MSGFNLPLTLSLSKGLPTVIADPVVRKACPEHGEGLEGKLTEGVNSGMNELFAERG